VFKYYFEEHRLQRVSPQSCASHIAVIRCVSTEEILPFLNHKVGSCIRGI
jgi:hypothetical protein